MESEPGAALPPPAKHTATEASSLKTFRPPAASPNPYTPVQITTTRKYEDRLETLKHVREAGISVCAGGIIGLGEDGSDRVGLLHTLATLPEHPESVPINRRVRPAPPRRRRRPRRPPTLAPLALSRCVGRRPAHLPALPSRGLLPAQPAANLDLTRPCAPP